MRTHRDYTVLDELVSRVTPRSGHDAQAVFCEYVRDLLHSLKDSGALTTFPSLGMLCGGLYDAAHMGFLRNEDCEAIFRLKIPFLRMFAQLNPGQMGHQPTVFAEQDPREEYHPKIKDLAEWAKGVDLAIEYPFWDLWPRCHVRFDLLSSFIDLLLFCIDAWTGEARRLSTPRTPYELRPWCPNKRTLEQLPVPYVALGRWRRLLMENERFRNSAAVFAEENAHLGFWVHHVPMEGLPDGALYSAGSGNLEDLQICPGSGRHDALTNMCRTYHLEMIGSFGHPPLAGRWIHFLPERVHFRKEATRLSVSLPGYYSLSMIEDARDGDFKAIDFILGEQKEKAARVTAPLSDRDMRRLGRELRKALLPAACDAARGGIRKQQNHQNRAFTVLSLIWASLNKGVGGIYKKPYARVAMTLPEAVRIAQHAVSHCDISICVLWNEVHAALIRDGKLADAPQEAVNWPYITAFAESPKSNRAINERRRLSPAAR